MSANYKTERISNACGAWVYVMNYYSPLEFFKYV